MKRRIRSSMPAGNIIRAADKLPPLHYTRKMRILKAQPRFSRGMPRTVPLLLRDILPYVERNGDVDDDAERDELRVGVEAQELEGRLQDLEDRDTDEG